MSDEVKMEHNIILLINKLKLSLQVDDENIMHHINLQ